MPVPTKTTTSVTTDGGIKNVRTEDLSGLTYRSLVAKLSQAAAAAPTSVRLVDTFGVSASWTRVSAGVYTLLLPDAYDPAKVTTFVDSNTAAGEQVAVSFVADLSGGKSGLRVETFLHDGVDSFDAADDILDDTSIELRFYL